MTADHSFVDLDATAQAALVRDGDVRPVELLDAAIERIERLDTELNAVIIRRFDEARAAAASGTLPDGPFRGVPFLIKDLGCAMAGAAHHAGNRTLKDIAWTEPADSDLARRFRRAGLVLVGRTNTPEIGAGMTTEPLAYGPSRNPWDTTRSTGGSSGGSAAAVASGMVAAAHGSDGGGSIRIPASECGLVGLKVSRGRVSAREPGEVDFDPGFAVHGVLTHSVRDTAALVDAIAVSRPGDPFVAPRLASPLTDQLDGDGPRLRVGFVTQLKERAVDTDPACVSAVEGAARLLEEHGHRVEDAHPEALDDGRLPMQYGSVFGADIVSRTEAWGVRTGHAMTLDDLEPTTRLLGELGGGLSGAQLVSALGWLQDFTVRMATWWADAGFDVLVTPTLTGPPPLVGTMVTPDNPLVGLTRGAALVPFTPAFNVTGQPAISLPLHWSDDGLPIGVQLVTAYGREDVLIRVAAELERAQPWAGRHPPIWG